MSPPKSLAFLGFGEAGRAYHDSLREVAPDLAFMAYDLKLAGPEGDEMRVAMDGRGVAVKNRPEALCAADWIISAVTADQSRAAVEPLLADLHSENILFDINSVSPERKQKTAALVETQGAVYVDMAVMTPVLLHGHRAPVLLAGNSVDEILPDLLRLEFSARKAGEAPGQATAIKMVRSLFVKGLEAIIVETLLAAEASGCFDEILGGLSQSYPGLDVAKMAEYRFERTRRHGARRAAEMEESARTLDTLGLTGELGRAIAEVQRRQGLAGPQKTPNALRDTVRETLAHRRDDQ